MKVSIKLIHIKFNKTLIFSIFCSFYESKIAHLSKICAKPTTAQSGNEPTTGKPTMMATTAAATTAKATTPLAITTAETTAAATTAAGVTTAAATTANNGK